VDTPILYFRFAHEVEFQPIQLVEDPEWAIVLEGSAAMQFEGDPDDNPFKPETPDRRAWEEGWAQAQSEDDETEDA